jgi:hypothetical protein
MFHVEQSVGAVRAIMRAPGAIRNNRTLDARQRGEREMTYPENKVRPFVHGYPLAYPFDDPPFEVKAACLLCESFNTHIYNLTEFREEGQGNARG